MDKKYAFILSSLITLLIFLDFTLYSFFQNESPPAPEAAEWDTLYLADGAIIKLTNIPHSKKESPLFGCLSARVFPSEEKILFRNLCTPYGGFTLQDESGKSFDIPAFSGKLWVFSGFGESNHTTHFLNFKSPIWNNDHDTLALLDASGNLVYHKSYGYP